MILKVALVAMFFGLSISDFDCDCGRAYGPQGYYDFYTDPFVKPWEILKELNFYVKFFRNLTAE